ncbi:MAG TPA: alpha/beta fold hydrolase [Xanthomonadaceae bacterium]|nr:alpha/beta fold hydrolase [Xanthomonadaceae bacterium]
MEARDYAPPTWLRGPHVQSVLSSSPLRRRRGARALAQLGAQTSEVVLDVGDGVRLQGFHSVLPRTPRGLVLLLHGWEGSTESGYMLNTAASVLEAGFDVFRLNFRDHGDTHHLNEDLFHSCRLTEVLNAARIVAERIPVRPYLVAGYSLGGNFALRIALHAPTAGIPLAHATAVCPVLDPAAGMSALETGMPLYHWYFMRKWRDSLRRKRALFPQRHDFDDATLKQDMRGLTTWMVERYTNLGLLEKYLDGYAVSGDRLAGLEVPVSILTAEDDPVIPVDAFRALQLPSHSRVEIAPFGGHCAFLEGINLQGFSEKWVRARLIEAADARSAPSPARAAG